ncbi:MAG: sulfurtransferase complex subunit TusB [Rhodocyclaceae bacterium]|nr:sulfurtransferase complex subunit TusB [Rhodocyclaceae bacterium]
MLHIVNKSPYERPALDSVLATMSGGAILLIEDGVYAAVKGGAQEAKIKAAMERFKVYALAADLEARGMADRVIEGVTVVDYGGFVDLVVEHKPCQSWL